MDKKGKTVTIDGYEITQAPNYHIMICKNGKPIFHAQCDHEFSDEEFREIYEHALQLIDSSAEYLEKRFGKEKMDAIIKNGR